MRDLRARTLFRSILAAVTSVSAACGGTMEIVDDEDAADEGGADAAADGSRKERQDDDGDAGPQFGGPDGSSGGSCKTGTVAYAPAFCLEPDAGETPSTPNPSDTCTLDCAKVCDAVVPDRTRVAESCMWTGTSGTIWYACGSCGVGRVPEGTAPCAEGSTLGERLAYQAYYEAVSVDAFRDLADVLDHAGAPDLAARARRCAEDEARHAAIFAELARAHGAEVPFPDRAPARRDLFDLALENAVEGCVRETYGALVTLHQAEHAEDPEIRAAFAAIADDEAEHAAFSWALDAWFASRLSADDVLAMRDARHRAASTLRARLSASSPLTRALGLPAPARAARMFDRVMQAAPSLAV